jgi:hypothetical protein
VQKITFQRPIIWPHVIDQWLISLFSASRVKIPEERDGMDPEIASVNISLRNFWSLLLWLVSNNVRVLIRCPPFYFYFAHYIVVSTQSISHSLITYGGWNGEQNNIYYAVLLSLLQKEWGIKWKSDREREEVKILTF